MLQFAINIVVLLKNKVASFQYKLFAMEENYKLELYYFRQTSINFFFNLWFSFITH